jgi:HEAT repeat protein
MIKTSIPPWKTGVSLAITLVCLLSVATTVRANSLEKALAALGECTQVNLKECPALAQLHKEPVVAIALLAPQLKHREPDKRILAAQSLRFFDGEEALTQLLMAFANERQKKVVQAMNENLEKIPRAQILTSTLSLLQSKEVGKRTLGTIVIGKRRLREHAHHLTTATKDTSRRVQHAAIRAMGEIGVPSMDVPLIQIAGNTETEWTLRQQALVSLGRINSENVIPMALVLTGHSEVPIRKAAITVLGEVGTTYGFTALLEGLKDPQTAGPSAMALGKLKQTTAAPMAAIALASPDLLVSDRAQLLWGIGMMKNPEVLPTLFQRLKTASMKEAIPLVQAIGHIGSQEALPQLIPVLAHGEPNVREMAQWALETITGQRLGAKAGPWWSWLKTQSTPLKKK